MSEEDKGTVQVVAGVAKKRAGLWLVSAIGVIPLLFLALVICIGFVAAAVASRQNADGVSDNCIVSGTSGFVYASQYGGPEDPSTPGHTGAYGDLTGKAAFAELSTDPNASPLDFAALGKLPGGTVLRVTNPQTGIMLIMEKLDVGAGGDSRPRIDLWYEPAAVLGFHGLGWLKIEPAQPGDVPSLTPIRVPKEPVPEGNGASYQGDQAKFAVTCLPTIDGALVDGSLHDPGDGPQDPGDMLRPRTRNIRNLVFARWGCDTHPKPCIREIGGYRPVDKYPDHPGGYAIDIVISDGISNSPTPVQTALGWTIACFVRANGQALGVEYIIWQGLIWWHGRDNEGGPGECSGGPAQGWRTYTGGSDITGGHYDHIHVTMLGLPR